MRFQPGKGPSRGLLRDCTTGCGTDGSFYSTNSVGYKIMLTTTPGYPAMSTMTPLVNNPYSVQQPSPDSQSFANMNLASPQHKQGNKAFMASWPLLSQKVENCRSSSTVVFDFHV